MRRSFLILLALVLADLGYVCAATAQVQDKILVVELNRQLQLQSEACSCRRSFVLTKRPTKAYLDLDFAELGCESVEKYKIPEKLRVLFGQQRITLPLQQLKQYAEQWFPAELESVIEICEAVNLIEGDIEHQYYHGVRLQAAKTRAAQRFLSFQTQWRHPLEE